MRGKSFAVIVAFKLAKVVMGLNASVNGIVCAVGNNAKMMGAGDLHKASVRQGGNLYRARAADGKTVKEYDWSRAYDGARSLISWLY